MMFNLWLDNQMFKPKIPINNLEKVNKHEDEIKKLGGKLSDLPRIYSAGQTIVTFPNGYGISFIKHGYSYGLEAAIITYQGEDWELCYDTPITDDVIGWMDDKDIIELLEQVSKLPNRKEEDTK